MPSTRRTPEATVATGWAIACSTGAAVSAMKTRSRSNSSTSALPSTMNIMESSTRNGTHDPLGRCSDRGRQPVNRSRTFSQSAHST